MGNRGGRASRDASAGVSLDGAGRGEDLVVVRPYRREPVIWLLAVLAVVLVATVVLWATRLVDPDLVGRLTGATAVPAGFLAIALAVRLRLFSWLDDETRRGWAFPRLALGGYLAGAV